MLIDFAKFGEVEVQKLTKGLVNREAKLKSVNFTMEVRDFDKRLAKGLESINKTSNQIATIKLDVQKEIHDSLRDVEARVSAPHR